MMMSQPATERQTKYCTAILEVLGGCGHATNLELLTALRRTYPGLSATTVHRATQRLATRGKIAVAPPTKDGSTRYDANLRAHDHFLCSDCGVLMDTDIKDKVVPILQDSIAGCNVSGRLTISGICKLCDKGVSK